MQAGSLSPTTKASHPICWPGHHRHRSRPSLQHCNISWLLTTQQPPCFSRASSGENQQPDSSKAVPASSQGPAEPTSIEAPLCEPSPVFAHPPEQQQQHDAPQQPSPEKEGTPVGLKPMLVKDTEDRFAMPNPQRYRDDTATVVLGIGILGCLIVALAWATHLDLNGSFRWEAADIQTGLQCLIPLVVMDASIMLPRYSASSSNISTSTSVSISKDASSLDLGIDDTNPLHIFVQGMSAAQVSDKAHFDYIVDCVSFLVVLGCTCCMHILLGVSLETILPMCSSYLHICVKWLCGCRCKTLMSSYIIACFTDLNHYLPYMPLTRTQLI